MFMLDSLKTPMYSFSQHIFMGNLSLVFYPSTCFLLKRDRLHGLWVGQLQRAAK